MFKVDKDTRANSSANSNYKIHCEDNQKQKDNTQFENNVIYLTVDTDRIMVNWKEIENAEKNDGWWDNWIYEISRREAGSLS